MISQLLRRLNREPDVDSFNSGAVRKRVGNDGVSGSDRSNQSEAVSTLLDNSLAGAHEG